MKLIKVILTIVMFTVFAGCKEQAYAQKKVPDAVKSTFRSMYPGEDDPDWVIDSHGNYESKFKIDGIHYRADFRPNGEWIETENNIDKDDLPKAIREVIKDRFNDEDISEIEKVSHHSKGAFYDVEFKRKGKNKDVEFRASGEIIN